MCTVDDPAIIRWINVGLGTEFEPEILVDVRRGPTQRLGYGAQVDNNSLDSIAFAFDLGRQGWHLVAEELLLMLAERTVMGWQGGTHRVGDVPADIVRRHDE